MNELIATTANSRRWLLIAVTICLVAGDSRSLVNAADEKGESPADHSELADNEMVEQVSQDGQYSVVVHKSYRPPKLEDDPKKVVQLDPELIAAARKKISDICANRQVPMIDILEIELIMYTFGYAMRDQKKMEELKCRKEYVAAILELQPILSDRDDVSLCSDDKFDLIRGYHHRYVSPKREIYRGTGDVVEVAERKDLTHHHLYKFAEDSYGELLAAPVAITQFFKAFVLQVSGYCKETLVANYEMASGLLSSKEKTIMKGIYDEVYGGKKAVYGAENTGEETGEETGEKTGEETDTDGEFFSDTDTETDTDTEFFSESDGESDTETGTNMDTVPSSKIDDTKTASAAGRVKGEAKQGGADKYKNRQYGQLVQFLDLVYMPELEGPKKYKDLERRKSGTIMDFSNNLEMNRRMHACKKRFKPIYDKLVIPIVRLAKLGYEYVGPEIEDIEDTLEKDKALLGLLAATKYCEQYGQIRLYETDDPDIKSMKELEYVVNLRKEFTSRMWIRNQDELKDAFDRIRIHRETGLTKFWHDTTRVLNKVLYSVNPMKSSFYRRNENKLANILNSGSITTNCIGIGFSLAGVING